MAYVYFIIMKPLHKLSFINPHNSPVGQVLLFHEGGGDGETDRCCHLIYSHSVSSRACSNPGSLTPEPMLLLYRYNAPLDSTYKYILLLAGQSAVCCANGV